MHKLQIQKLFKKCKNAKIFWKMLLALFVNALDDNHRRRELREAIFQLINSTLTKERDEVKQAVRYIPAFSCSISLQEL